MNNNFNEVALGIDIGGTAIKIGVVSAKGELLNKQSYKMDKRSQDTVVRMITESVVQYIADLGPKKGKGSWDWLGWACRSRPRYLEKCA